MEISPGEDPVGVRAGRPPMQRCGRAVEELVPVGGDDQGKARMRFERERYETHGTNTST